jgi:hypothetical protein
MAEIISLQIDAKVGDAIEATKSLKTQLKEATNEAQKLAAKYGETSTEAINAAKKTAVLKEQLADFKGTVDALNPEAKFKAIGQVAQGIAGGFAAAQGAMALFGVESEEVEKQLLKVQGALALSEGLNTIMGLGDAFGNLKIVAVNAFNAIKGAIGATGIGLIVVALGVMYSQWDNIKAAIGGAEAEADKYLENLKKQNSELDKQYEKELRIAKAKGKDTTILEQQIATEKLVKINKEASESFKRLKDLQNQYNTALDESLSANEAQQTKGVARATRIEKEIKAEEKKYYTLSQLQAKAITDSQVARFTAETKAEKDAEKGAKAEVAAVKKVKVEAQESEFDRILREESEKSLLKAKAEDDYLEVLKQKKQEQLEAEQYYADFIDGIDADASKAKIQRNKDELTQQEAIRLARLSIAQSTVDGLSSIGTIFIKDQKKLEKFQKGVALAQIAVDTAKAISSLVAYSNANPLNSVTFGAAGIAQYATGIASILANVAKAKQLLSSAGSGAETTSLSGGGGGGGNSGTIPSPSGGANLGSATPNQQSTLLNNSAINSSSLNQNYVKAVVVETDITDAQNRIQGIQNKSKFG